MKPNIGVCTRRWDTSSSKSSRRFAAVRPARNVHCAATTDESVAFWLKIRSSSGDRLGRPERSALISEDALDVCGVEELLIVSANALSKTVSVFWKMTPRSRLVTA